MIIFNAVKIGDENPHIMSTAIFWYIWESPLLSPPHLNTDIGFDNFIELSDVHKGARKR